MRIDELQSRIEALVRGEGNVRSREGHVVDDAIELLDEGALRVCEPIDGQWMTHVWVKQAILLSFARWDASGWATASATRSYTSISSR